MGHASAFYCIQYSKHFIYNMNKNSKLRFKGENKREQFKSPRVSNPHPKDSLQPSISSITSDFKTYMRTYRK